MVFSGRQLAFLALASGLATLTSATPVQRDNVLKAPITKKANKLSAKDIVKLDVARASSFVANAASSAPVVNEDVTYAASVKVGSQTFSLIVDTGSSNTWVGAGTKYKSTTGKSTGDTFSVTYGSGSVSGTEYTDTVTIGSATVTSQLIGAATTASGFTGFDGIVGFGPVDLTEGTVTGLTEEPTFLDNLKAQGTISTEVLGVSFLPESGSDTSDSNGEITFGGVDSTKYTGSIVYTAKSTVSPYSYYWGVNVGAVTYGSTTLLASGDSAIVDTGTTLIYIPILGYQKFLSATGGSTDSSSGLAVFSTKPTGTITINIGGTGWTLSPAQYLVPTAQYSYYGLSSGKYYSYINDGGLSQSEVNFIIGQKFLENYYSVFDTTNSRIGFATAV